MLTCTFSYRVKLLHLCRICLVCFHSIAICKQRERIHRTVRKANVAVLNFSTVATLVLVFYLVLVCHHKLVVLLGVHLAALTHLLALILAPSWLHALTLIHLRLHYLELVKFCLCRHADTTIATRTTHQASPKVRKLLDYSRIVAYGFMQMARLIQ